MIEQHFIKIRASDLISVISLRAIGILEVELRPCFGTRAKHFAAELFHEPDAGEFFVQSHSSEGFHAKGQKRFTNVETRKLFAFDRSEEHTSELQSRRDLVCRLLL